LKQREFRKLNERKYERLCEEVREGVTVDKAWTNHETILKTAVEESIRKDKRNIMIG
jgi:hypothetical protein